MPSRMARHNSYSLFDEVIHNFRKSLAGDLSRAVCFAPVYRGFCRFVEKYFHLFERKLS